MFRDSEAPINDALWDVNTSTWWASSWTFEQYRDTGFLMPFLRHNQNDYFQIKLQMDHQRKLQSLLDDVHIHMIPMSNASGDVYFQVQYYWSNLWTEIPEIASWTTTNVTVSLTSASQYKHILVGLLADITPPANETVSSVLMMKVTRLGNNALDTYSTNKTSGTGAANVWILYLDAHTKTERFWWPIS